jgi:lipoprotein-releasing system ATP-binding protein
MADRDHGLHLASFRVNSFNSIADNHRCVVVQFAPAMLANVPQDEIKGRALHWLGFMGLTHRANHYPNQLSGGELQRVAIARALIRNPRILLADEPTGNLDSENSIKIQNLFFELQKQLGLTLVVVTHDLQFAQQFSKIYRMKDGRLTSN